jgi:hypothetical protein
MNRFMLGLFWIALSLGGSPLVWADAVTDWNANAGKATIAAGIDPLNASRMYAMVHIAIHDALNAIDLRFEPYALDIRGPSEASPEAAVATAARDVLVPILNQMPLPQGSIDVGVASVETDYDAALEAIANGTPKTAGVVIGHDAAAAILAVRVADGSDAPLTDESYPQGTRPGEYRFTPGVTSAFGTEWGNVTPFVLEDGNQFQPGPPYAVTSRKYTADFNEVKALGAKDGSTRMDDQTQIAHFWAQSS